MLRTLCVLSTGCVVTLGAASLCSATRLEDHQYRYDGPEIQQTVNEMKARHDYLELRAGSTLKTGGRLLTITAVHQDRVALLVEGTYKNLTAKPMMAGTAGFGLNESPDRQMKWFKAHPVTAEYHYGPGWNSHNEALATIAHVEPSQTSTFVAVWNLKAETIAAEQPTDLVILVANWPE